MVDFFLDMKKIFFKTKHQIVIQGQSKMTEQEGVELTLPPQTHLHVEQFRKTNWRLAELYSRSCREDLHISG